MHGDVGGFQADEEGEEAEGEAEGGAGRAPGTGEEGAEEHVELKDKNKK